MSPIDLRIVNGERKAFRGSREIPIPAPPKLGADITSWARWMNSDTLRAAFLFYYDRWCWETGSTSDWALHRALDKEIKRRQNIGSLPQEEQDQVTIDFLDLVQHIDPGHNQ